MVNIQKTVSAAHFRGRALEPRGYAWVAGVPGCICALRLETWVVSIMRGGDLAVMCKSVVPREMTRALYAEYDRLVGLGVVP